MRTAVIVCLSLLALLAAPGNCETAPSWVLGPDGRPLEVRAEVPMFSAVGLSYALPGGSQFYLGQHDRGWLYAGSSLAMAALLAYFPTTRTESFFPSGEQIAFTIVQGVALSWLGVGTVSAIDAYQAIAAQQPPFEDDAPVLRSHRR